MSKTTQKTFTNQQLGLFLKGLIIGKVMTILVIGGLLWWLLKPSLSGRNTAELSSEVSSETPSNTTSSFQTVAEVPVGSFNYGGSTAWAPIRQLVDSQIHNARPELQLNYVDPNNGGPSSSSGIRMLLDGQLDFAETSRPLTSEEYAIARQRGFILEQRQVATDAIAVVVNPSLNVSGLTIDQLQQIYLGEITNWKQVGGPDLPITPFSQFQEEADKVIFSANEDLQKQPLSAKVQYVYSTTEAVRKVSTTPGGVYYGSARALVPQCSVKPLPLGNTPTELIPPYRSPLVSAEDCPKKRNQLNTEAIKNGSYPITTDLFVIVKQNKAREQQVGEAYARLLLTEQGQRAIQQAGFIALP
jgi:phosphate transport system substrate-binding protein